MNENIAIDIAPIDETIDTILEKINTFFLKDIDDKFVSPEIENQIAALIDELKEDVYCLIEYPYVDKVYRDSYYQYFSSKHFTYQRDCIRVSLFDGEISPNDFLDPEKHRELNNQFLGFFVLRPTLNALFGRSMLSPRAFEDNSYKINSCKASCLVYGVKLEVEGFPHSSQDGETIKCAETTIWTLMEYFGNKYPEYKPALPAKIHQALERFSYQRQLPSNGLTMDQISFALKEFGFGTRVYSDSAYGRSLYEIIDCYVESGIPVIVGLQSGNVGHVIIAIGKEYTTNLDWDQIKTDQKELNSGSDSGIIETSTIPASYVVQDDNLIPYKLIRLDKPGEHYDDADCAAYKIDSIVVPLYPKIYLEAVVAKELAFQVLEDRNVGYCYDFDVVFRFYLTSSRSFKNHVAKIQEMDTGLKNNILITKMPKFIWCAELYSPSDFDDADKQANGIIILDATQANQVSIDALIFAGYPDKCVSMNENNFVLLPRPFKNFRYFSNLK